MTNGDGASQLHYLPPQRCSGDALIEMSQIVKTFRNAAGEFKALKGVTACFDSGEFVSVVGKSGSGKSTLVNMITGIDHPTSGTVRVGDVYVHALDESDRSVWRGANLGIVFQFFQLLPTLTLLENVMLPMFLKGHFSPAQRELRSLELLKTVGLEGLEYKLPAAVSGGQQQSAAIARALANDPPILIADEPTGNLDERTADEVFDLFSTLIDQGKTILMVTHDISLAQRTTRTLLLSDGELIHPWIASAFSNLSYSEMLWLTHHLRPVNFEGGQVLDRAQYKPEWVLLVDQGRLEVFDAAANPDGTALDVLDSGGFLSSFDLDDHGSPQLSIRASQSGPVELLVLEGLEFQDWLRQTPACETLLREAAGQRSWLAQLAADGRSRQ